MKENQSKFSNGNSFKVPLGLQIAFIKQALKGKYVIKMLLLLTLYFLITGLVINVNWLIKLMF